MTVVRTALRSSACRALWMVALAACGSARTTVRPSSSPAPVASRSSRSLGAPASVVDALRSSVADGDPQRLAGFGLTLARAGGAREMTGEPAADEHVSQVTVLARHDDAAALLLLTSCGNASLASWRWAHDAWTVVAHRTLVTDMRPGRCATTSVHGEALALSSDARREMALVVASQDATGDTVHGPVLSVLQLEPNGTMIPLLEDAPFGATDDASGATTTGAYLVVDDIPPPRDLNVTIRPGRPGPGGPPAAQVTRRRYGLRHGRLELIEEGSESAP